MPKPRCVILRGECKAQAFWTGNEKYLKPATVMVLPVRELEQLLECGSLNWNYSWRGEVRIFGFLGGKVLYDILCSESSKAARIWLLARQYFVVGLVFFVHHDEFCNLSLKKNILKITKHYLCYLHSITVSAL